MPDAQEESMSGNVLNDLGARAAAEDEAAEDVLAPVMMSNNGRMAKIDQ